MPATSSLAGRSAAPATAIATTRSTSATGRRSTRSSPRFQPDAVLHLAAESHVDRSIDGAAAVHRHQCRRHLHAARSRPRLLAHARRRPPAQRFRFQHISTDEVFGSLGPIGQVHRDHALRTQLALLREQGRVRSSGARLAPYVRTAGAHHQLLQQLRPLSVSREADPADDHPRACAARGCRSTARARTCATGCMSRTTPRP